jgi:hypothetical protein
LGSRLVSFELPGSRQQSCSQQSAYRRRAHGRFATTLIFSLSVLSGPLAMESRATGVGSAEEADGTHLRYIVQESQHRTGSYSRRRIQTQCEHHVCWALGADENCTSSGRHNMSRKCRLIRSAAYTLLGTWPLRPNWRFIASCVRMFQDSSERCWGAMRVPKDCDRCDPRHGTHVQLEVIR